MLMNGIDYTARKTAMIETGIDPEGRLTEYTRVLGTKFAYCNQHLNVHTTDSGCTVGLIEQFPLKATTMDEARDECRQRDFRLHMENCPCVGCGETLAWDQSNSGWVTLDGRERKCAKARNMYGTHTPVDSVPLSAAASL